MNKLQTKQAKELLDKVFGIKELRPSQREIIERVLKGKICWRLCLPVRESLCAINCRACSLKG